MKRSSVCPLNTSPCVHSTRLRANFQNVTVFTGTTGTFRTYTWGRVEWTHRGFSAFHTPHTAHTTHHTHHNSRQDTTQHNMTHHNPPQQHDHNTTRRLTERRHRRQRQREEKTKGKKTREERRFIFSVVVHGRSQLMECFVLFIPSITKSLACYIGSSTIVLWLLSAHLGRSTIFFCEIYILCSYSFEKIRII